MRHVRILTLCLVAACAAAAVATTTASAKLPEWGKCEAAAGHEGKYGDANCTEPVKKVFGHYTGGYEWVPLEETQYFNTSNIGPTTFETTNGKKIQCSEGILENETVHAPNLVTQMLFFFHGCESEGRLCKSEFEENGTISNYYDWLEAEAIEGELVYLSGKGTNNPTVGLTLTTEVPGKHLFRTVVCEGELGTVFIGGEGGGKRSEKAKGNAALGIVSPIDEMATEFTQTFNQTAGVQEYVKAQKGKDKTLQMLESNDENKWFQLGISSSIPYITEGGTRHPHPVEIKATP